MTERSVNLYFGSKIANLYDLGYLTVDLHQLSVFSNLIESGQSEESEKYFGEKARPINRYMRELTKGSNAEIIDVKKGSVELILAGLGALASIVMPIVAIKIERELDLNSKTIKFEISPQDERIKTHLESYKNGTFGSGEQALQNLFEVLQRLNYSITIRAEDIYSIEHVTNKYAQRMVKTIIRNSNGS